MMLFTLTGRGGGIGGCVRAGWTQVGCHLKAMKETALRLFLFLFPVKYVVQYLRFNNAN